MSLWETMTANAVIGWYRDNFTSMIAIKIGLASVLSLVFNTGAGLTL